MKLIILASLLFVGCGDDQDQQKTVTKKATKQTEVVQQEETETVEETAERINANIDAVEEKVQQERLKRMQERFEEEGKRIQQRNKGLYTVYCTISTLTESFCTACLNDDKPTESMRICNASMDNLYDGGQCYKRIEECLAQLED